MWAGSLGDGNRLTCGECRKLAEANGKEPECGGCSNARPMVGLSPQNAAALESWRLLDSFGRGLDGFSGVPLPIRMESIDSECARQADPDGIRWRIIAIEEKVYGMRVERFRARQDKNKG